MSKAYENLHKTNDQQEHSYMRSIKSHNIRKKDVIEDQNRRIQTAINKDFKVECTFKPEINKKTKVVGDKDATHVNDSDFDFIKS